ncbi:MAG: zinc-dependent alcohol dehydrogenase family protein [Sandaracinaceae bacterium]
MRAMIFEGVGRPLRRVERAPPRPGPGQVRLTVRACGVCRTDLHIVDGELDEPELPLVLGHEVVGVVDALGAGVDRFAVGDRVGVPWLGHVDGTCRFCRSGAENLCDGARFTGYQLDGGYAEQAVADASFCFPLPEGLDDVEAAPLLCAGLIGWRAARMAMREAAPVERVGIYGFGAAAHIVAQVLVHRGVEVYGFVRPGDDDGAAFARSLGAVWAGGSDRPPPAELDAALLFAPVGALVPAALRAVRKGGAVIAGGIHMSELPAMPYAILWGERVLRSVANLTRQDAVELLELAPRVPVRTETTTYPLEDAQRALDDLRAGRFTGAAVLVP